MTRAAPASKRARRLRTAALVVTVLVGIGLVVRFARPSLSHYEANTGFAAPGPAARAPGSDDSVRVTFMGTATLLFDDGETAFMTDGFFDRVRMGQVAFGKLSPDRALVSRMLARANVTRLAAVIPIHSHYDHALDSPLVAELTGARLVGSQSSANIGRGWGLPEERIHVVKDREAMSFGRFRVTFVVSAHSPGDHYPGTIDRPVVPPAPADAYRTGECYSLLVEHGDRTFLVHGSSGYVAHGLDGQRAEVVFLGVGSVGKLTDDFRESYWREVVSAVGARRVVVIHWDDFFVPLDEPLVALPYVADNFATTMTFLRSRSNAERVDIRIPEVFVPFDPLVGIERRQRVISGD